MEKQKIKVGFGGSFPPNYTQQISEYEEVKSFAMFLLSDYVGQKTKRNEKQKL